MSFRPPENIDQNIVQHIREEMDPSHKKILAKLFLVHLFVGTITLLFCPQFDFSLTGRYEVFHFFHHTFGYYGCLAICGALFIGSGALFASAILTWDELNSVRKSFFLHIMAITALFIGFFVVLDAEVYFEASLAWSLGAYLGGCLSFHISQGIRQICSQQEL